MDTLAEDTPSPLQAHLNVYAEKIRFNALCPAAPPTDYFLFFRLPDIPSPIHFQRIFLD